MNKTRRDIIVVGFALFAMFLGAGNLIFPPYLGFHSGENWLPVLFGFVLTGVGLPFLGVYATLKSGGTVLTLGSPVGRKFAIFASVLVILAIGPMFAIPRTAATVHEIGVVPIFGDVSPVITALVFFGITLYLSIGRSTVVDRVGKILTPFLLITLFSIIIAAIVNPIGTPAVVEKAYTFAGGFTEGYQTLDALAATMFAGVALSGIVSRGYDIHAEQLRLTIYCGVIAATLLGLVYCGLLYAGATASGVLPADLERTTLLVEITRNLLGSAGAYFLAAAVSLACLTTSVGLCVVCGEYFNDLSGGKWSYKAVVIVTVIVSALISILGVSMIINLAVPVLYLMYPVIMVLILFTCFDKYIRNKRAYLGGIIGAFSISIIDALGTLSGVGISGGFIDTLLAFQATLPLAKFGLSWVLPALILAAVFSFIPQKDKA